MKYAARTNVKRVLASDPSSRSATWTLRIGPVPLGTCAATDERNAACATGAFSSAERKFATMRASRNLVVLRESELLDPIQYHYAVSL